MISTLLHATPHRSGSAQTPRIAEHIAQIWLALGVLAIICIPELRGRSEWIGAMPFWLVGIPLANLLLLRWRNVLGASRSTFAHLGHRHASASAPMLRAGRKSRSARRRPTQGQFGSLVAVLFR